MSPFLIVVLAILAILISFQFLGYYKSKKSVGSPIPFEEIEQECIEKIKGKMGLIYFYSPRCSNCKTQAPIIDKISEKFDDIVSIDATKNLQTARAFNVLGTPSIILFGDDKIKGYFVGVKSEAFLEAKLKSS